MSSKSVGNSTADELVFIRAKFSIPPHRTHDAPPTQYHHSFNESNCTPIMLGLPEGSIPSKVSNN
jgi:hypothetical protein